MFKREYQQWMDEVRMDRDFQDRLAEAMCAPLPRRRRRRPGRVVLAAAAVCALLAVSALAVSPTLRQALEAALGSFAPYRQAVEGVWVEDQGIRVRVVSTLADENDGMAYLEVTDRTGDRLDGISAWDTLGMQSAAYDPETRTALFACPISLEARNGDGTATLSLSRLLTGVERFEGVKLPWELVTEERLETLTVPEGETGGTALVLKPGQTPARLDTDLFTLSSMGFDSRGDFHVQIAFADGVAACLESNIYTDTLEGEFAPNYEDRRIDSIFLEDGRYLDITYSMYTVDRFGQFRVDDLSGTVTTAPAIEGAWELTFPLEVLPPRSVSVREELMGLRLETIRLTAMSLRLEAAYLDPEQPVQLGSLPVRLYCSDGRVLELEYQDWSAVWVDQSGEKTDRDGLLTGVRGSGGAVYGALFLWKNPQAVDPADVEAVSVGQRYLPLDGSPAVWLE